MTLNESQLKTTLGMYLSQMSNGNHQGVFIVVSRAYRRLLNDYQFTYPELIKEYSGKFEDLRIKKGEN